VFISVRPLVRPLLPSAFGRSRFLVAAAPASLPCLALPSLRFSPDAWPRGVSLYRLFTSPLVVHCPSLCAGSPRAWPVCLLRPHLLIIRLLPLRSLLAPPHRGGQLSFAAPAFFVCRGPLAPASRAAFLGVSRCSTPVSCFASFTRPFIRFPDRSVLHLLCACVGFLLSFFALSALFFGSVPPGRFSVLCVPGTPCAPVSFCLTATRRMVCLAVLADTTHASCLAIVSVPFCLLPRHVRRCSLPGLSLFAAADFTERLCSFFMRHAPLFSLLWARLLRPTVWRLFHFSAHALPWSLWVPALPGARRFFPLSGWPFVPRFAFPCFALTPSFSLPVSGSFSRWRPPLCSLTLSRLHLWSHPAPCALASSFFHFFRESSPLRFCLLRRPTLRGSSVPGPHRVSLATLPPLLSSCSLVPDPPVVGGPESLFAGPFPVPTLPRALAASRPSQPIHARPWPLSQLPGGCNPARERGFVAVLLSRTLCARCASACAHVLALDSGSWIPTAFVPRGSGAFGARAVPIALRPPCTALCFSRRDACPRFLAPSLAFPCRAVVFARCLYCWWAFRASAPLRSRLGGSVHPCAVVLRGASAAPGVIPRFTWSPLLIAIAFRVLPCRHSISLVPIGLAARLPRAAFIATVRVLRRGSMGFGRCGLPGLGCAPAAMSCFPVPYLIPPVLRRGYLFVRLLAPRLCPHLHWLLPGGLRPPVPFFSAVPCLSLSYWRRKPSVLACRQPSWSSCGPGFALPSHSFRSPGFSLAVAGDAVFSTRRFLRGSCSPPSFYRSLIPGLSSRSGPFLFIARAAALRLPRASSRFLSHLSPVRARRFLDLRHLPPRRFSVTVAVCSVIRGPAIRWRPLCSWPARRFLRLGCCCVCSPPCGAVWPGGPAAFRWRLAVWAGLRAPCFLRRPPNCWCRPVSRARCPPAFSFPFPPSSFARLHQPPLIA